LEHTKYCRSFRGTSAQFVAHVARDYYYTSARPSAPIDIFLIYWFLAVGMIFFLSSLVLGTDLFHNQSTNNGLLTATRPLAVAPKMIYQAMAT
jgi:hypothetical protein